MRKVLSLFGIAALIFAASCNNGTTENGGGDTKPKHKYVRYNVNTPQGQKALASMKKALDSMRKLDCSDVRSWYYQGAIHWIPDTIQNNPFCSSYANKSQLKKAWDNCTHTQGSEINFLAWHRLYIYHFEQIVRKLSGDTSFALPYWGYTDTTNVEANRTMNKMFREAGSSLYTQSRFDSLNQGQPINGPILEALDITKLMKKTDIFVFTKNIDQAPHGAMHDYIGGGNAQVYPLFNPIYNRDCNDGTCDGGLMRNVPSAGFDPIFFSHHSNIDRLWQQWTNSKYGKLLTAKDLNDYPWSYVFFDAEGKEVTYNTDQVLAAVYNVDYEFDDTPTPSVEADTATKKKPSLFLSAKQFADTIVSQKVNKVMKGDKLEFSVKNDAKKMTNLMSTANNATPKTVMVTMTVSFTTQPNVIYKVFINQPKGQPMSTKSDYFAGFLTFFGAKLHASHMADGRTATGLPTKTFIFEMTEEFSATNAASKGTYDVSIVTASGAAAPEITVESISVFTK